MSDDNHPTDYTLADVFATDQDIEGTAGMVGRYYERLRASGIPKQAASQMTMAYNAVVIAQHVGMDVSAMYTIEPEWEN